MIAFIDRTLAKLEGGAMILCMATATLLTVAQVLMRYAFNAPLFWAEELVLYSIICMSFVGIGYGVGSGSHISVDVLGAAIPEKHRRILLIIGAGLGVIFGLSLLYLGFRLSSATFARGQLSPALRIPVALVYCVIPIAGVATTFRYLLQIHALLRGRSPDAVEKTSQLM
jgi:C4-dicarboxylate transporter DctQ subunit